MQDSIFTVFDQKAGAHLPPFFMHNANMAIRTFTDCINSEEHQFSHHPEDYTLFNHGSFENENAAFNLFHAPKSLGNGVEFIQIPTNEKIPREKISNDPPVRLNPESQHTA
nr:MAG: nonstructural protein [Microvirus sp.]